MTKKILLFFLFSLLSVRLYLMFISGQRNSPEITTQDLKQNTVFTQTTVIIFKSPSPVKTVYLISPFCDNNIPPSKEPNFNSTITPTVTKTPVQTATPIIITEEELSNEQVTLEIKSIDIRSILGTVTVSVKNPDEIDFSQISLYPILLPIHLIGENGVTLIIGHRTWNLKPKVFAHLDKLHQGEEIVIFSQTKQFIYTITGTDIVIDPSSVWKTIEEYNQYFLTQEKSGLILLTCTPYGTDKKRLLVVAILSKSDSKETE